MATTERPKQGYMVMGTMYWDEAHLAGGWPGIGFCPVFATFEEAMAVAAIAGIKVIELTLTPVTPKFIRDEVGAK